MGKGKSVLLIVLVTIVLAGLLFIGFTPSFAVGVSDFGSLLSNVDLGTDLGGGYTTVYYPEGVMSASDYAIEDDETQADYTQYKGIYLSNENYDADTQQVTEEFSSEFNKAYAALSYRYEQMGFVNASVVKENDYTIRVTIPHLSDDTVLDTVFTQLSYSGSLHLSDSEITTSNAERRAEVWDSSLVSSAGVVSAGDQGYAVTINFTAEGRAKFAELTAGMVSSSDSSSSSSSSGTLYIYVGMNQIITVSVSEEMDQDTIYISGSFTTREAAQSIASTINSVLNEDDVFDLNINYSYLYEFAPTMGENHRGMGRCGGRRAFPRGDHRIARQVQGHGARVHVRVPDLASGAAAVRVADRRHRRRLRRRAHDRAFRGGHGGVQLLRIQQHPQRIFDGKNAYGVHQIGIQKEHRSHHRRAPRACACGACVVACFDGNGRVHVADLPHRHGALGPGHAARNAVLSVYVHGAAEEQDRVLQFQERGGGRR